jgi:hypothetical protein
LLWFVVVDVVVIVAVDDGILFEVSNVGFVNIDRSSSWRSLANGGISRGFIWHMVNHIAQVEVSRGSRLFRFWSRSVS